jgi:hypothetical protein
MLPGKQGLYDIVRWGIHYIKRCSQFLLRSDAKNNSVFFFLTILNNIAMQPRERGIPVRNSINVLGGLHPS